MQNDKSKFKKLIFAFCILIFLHLLSYIIPAFSSSGVIKAIEVEGLSRIKEEELKDLISLRPGDIIDRDALRRGVKRAFKKGIFSDIKVVVEPFEDGVRLKYIVREIPLINHISIKGNELISERKVKKALILKEGGDFKEELLKIAERELLNFYVKKGFPDVRVRIEKEKHRDMINLHIAIQEGKPLIIKSVSTPLNIKGLMKLKEGDIFDREQVDKDIDRIRRYYKEHGYIKPTIGPYEFRDGELIIPAYLGARLEIEFKGNTILSSKKLLKEMPFMEDEEVTEELVKDTINRIQRLYWQKGYNHAEVVSEFETKEDIIKVTFFISEGKRVILRDIRFEGITVSPQTLEALIPLRRQKPFDETLLDTAKESITGFYNALGYLEAEVKDVRKEFVEEGKAINLIFTVHEGHQTKIEKLNITGNHVLSSEELRGALMLKESVPYNAVDIEDARYRILSQYSRLGYIDAYIDVESIIEDGRAFVTFKIIEGMPSYIGKVVVRGKEKTKDKIIRREFAIREGDPYNYEKLSRTRQNLYKLGLFTDISIEPITATETQIDKGMVKDILISLKEGKAGAVEVGVGYGEYEKFRGFFDISYRNLGGYHRQVGLRTEMSSVERRYILSFREPWFLNKPLLSSSALLMKEYKKSINLDTRETMYKIDRTSLLLGVEKEITERLKANLNYEYSIIETKDVKPGVILSKEDTGTLGISSISPSLFYDTRDNPFDPTAGSLKGIVLKFASRSFLSETEFVKVILQSSWFFKIQRGLIFASSLKGGSAYGLGDTVELPLIERFFLGGRTTVRGYNQDTLGPKGADDTPTGGNAFVLVNGELRVSLGKGIGLVTFVDAGNVWKKSSDIELALKYTTGIGLRYNTPVGPFRLDYGHKLNRERGESRGELHFSLGHAF